MNKGVGFERNWGAVKPSQSCNYYTLSSLGTILNPLPPPLPLRRGGEKFCGGITGFSSETTEGE